MKVLSVDDGVENLYLLESMLRPAGYEVVSAHNGVEALEKLEREKFELIISDILMPQMDGFELCRQIKQQDALRHIPFVFYTATYTEKKDRELGLSIGASRFLVKPTDPAELLAVVHEVIENHEADRLGSAPPTAEKEEVLLRAYNLRLVQKLNQKVEQLGREVLDRRKAEAEVRSLNAELEERVRQRTAELTAAYNGLETFTATVSHDLRAPLRVIGAYSEILAVSRGDKLDEEARTWLNSIQSQVQRMGRLIEALLQLSRATRGELRREAVNLSQLAVEIEGDLRREQPNRRVDFIIAPGLVARGDPALLRSVLQNLLGNAWKFTAKSPEARIEFGQVMEDGKAAYCVSDNGAGFDMKNVGKLFAPFHRLHDPTDYPGAGIGLATVQQIIHRHGGRVWVSGAVGKGAAFYFTLE